MGDGGGGGVRVCITFLCREGGRRWSCVCMGRGRGAVGRESGLGRLEGEGAYEGDLSWGV